MIADFHFLRPFWLLGLLAAGLLAWSSLRRDDPHRRWGDIVAPHLLAHLVVPPARRWRIRPVHLTVAAVALGSVALAGPTWDRERAPFVEDEAPLVVAIDLSDTMDDGDVTPSRLGRAKLKVHDLLELRSGSRTALFAYAGSAHMVLPLTDDAGLVGTYVDALATRLMPVPGRDTAAALRLATSYLEGESAPGTILFMTDGVEESSFAAFEAGAGKNEIMVLAIGSSGGGQPLDLDGLRQLQSQAGIELATMTVEGDADVKWVQRRAQTHLERMQVDDLSRWADRGWWLTIPLTCLAALWFRKGWAMHWVVVVLAFSFAGTPREARALDWSHAFVSSDQQGRRAFDKGDFPAAGRLFADPMWKGVALYRSGDFEGAAAAFAATDAPEADYNRANALAHLGRLDAAVTACRRALERRPDWPEAKANLEILVALAADANEDDDTEGADPGEPPDASQFDERGKKGKVGKVEVGQQSADIWMRNIAVTPADLLARKFAIEAEGNR